MLFFSAYLVVGVVSGVMAGLLGIGGGLIIVPALLFLFSLQGFPHEVAVHLAIGTSLAAVTVTAIASTRSHHRKGTVEWSIWTKLVPGLLFGPIIGAAIAHALPGTTLRIFFGLFELAVAAHILLGKQPSGRAFPSVLTTFGISSLVGIVCALVGIGGGIMVVPFLLWAGLGIKNAVSTSAACGLPIAVAGALSFALLGSAVQELPSGSSGYLYWPALVGISLTSVWLAPVGAKWAHTLSADMLRRVFAAFLTLLGIVMLMGF